jgi:ribosomal protein S6
MAKRTTKGGSQRKEVRAWGVRRRKVDINQLALAYYLLARIRIEEQRQSDGSAVTTSDDRASPEGAEPSSEAA